MLILGKISIIIFVILFMIYIFSLVKKQTLRVEYSIYWLVVSVPILLCVLCNKLLLILTVLILAMVFIIIDLTIVISKMQTSVKELTQDVGLIKFEQEEKKES